MAMNVVSLNGHAAATPTATEVEGGSVAELDLLLSRHRPNEFGDWQHETMPPVRVEIPGKQGAACVELVKAGSPVGIVGRLDHDERGIRVVAHQVDFLGVPA